MRGKHALGGAIPIVGIEEFSRLIRENAARTQAIDADSRSFEVLRKVARKLNNRRLDRCVFDRHGHRCTVINLEAGRHRAVDRGHVNDVATALRLKRDAELLRDEEIAAQMHIYVFTKVPISNIFKPSPKTLIPRISVIYNRIDTPVFFLNSSNQLIYRILIGDIKREGRRAILLLP